MKALRILNLEDSVLDAELVHATLTDGGVECEILRVQTRADFAAAHEASEGSGYLVIVFAGDEAMDPVVVSELPSLLDLLGKLVPIVSASQK